MNSVVTTYLRAVGGAKWFTYVRYALAGLLAFIGFAGIRGVFEPSQLLGTADPLLGISQRYVCLAVSLLQLLAAWACLFAPGRSLSLGLTAWATTNLLAYRAGLWTLGWPHPYGWDCGLMTGLNTSPLRADILSLGAVGLLLLGSVAALWLEYDRRQRAQFSKMSCPACGGHVKFAVRNLGQTSSCPHCHKSITLRQAEYLKIACFFCHHHIEFPSHALGRKLRCPHCGGDITLKESIARPHLV